MRITHYPHSGGIAIPPDKPGRESEAKRCGLENAGDRPVDILRERRSVGTQLLNQFVVKTHD